MSSEALEKVTCFLTRVHNGKKQLLLFKHLMLEFKFLREQLSLTKKNRNRRI